MDLFLYDASKKWSKDLLPKLWWKMVVVKPMAQSKLQGCTGFTFYTWDQAPKNSNTTHPFPSLQTPGTQCDSSRRQKWNHPGPDIKNSSNKYKLSLGRKRVFYPRSMCNVTSHKTSISHLQKKGSNLWNVPQMFLSNTFGAVKHHRPCRLYLSFSHPFFCCWETVNRGDRILVVFFLNPAVWSFHQDHQMKGSIQLVCSKKQDVTQGARSDPGFLGTQPLESNSKLDDWKMRCIDVPFGAFSLGPIFRG